ncbi:MAG: hypothetical protein VKJ04_08650 [Vampirovibrionales bacterium]|nr:hypothetical protein [Vampirovibrionales bacterium]
MPSKATNKVTKLNTLNSRHNNETANKPDIAADESVTGSTAQVTPDAQEAVNHKVAKAPAFDAEDIQQHLKRIIKLTTQAENPGMAYRNLETIKALAESLAKKLEISVHEEPSAKSSKS